MPRPGLLSIPLLCAAAALGHAQPTLLDAGYRQMYNLQFAEAHQSFEQWQRQHPDDPMGFVSDAAAYLFSEFDRLHILQSEFFTHDQHFVTDHKLTPDPMLKLRFEAALATTRQLAARTPGDKNAMFASLLAGGLHSDYVALIDKRYVASFKEMKASRQEAERLLAADPGYCDAWVAVGVENYMLSIKPLIVRWVLRAAGGQADRDLGIEKLRLTAAKGHYLAPFARLLLAVAAMREGDAPQARALLTGLAQEFPRNPLFPQELERLNASASRSGRP
jgi:tetratricopeptide (TPR) repeat protein